MMEIGTPYAQTEGKSLRDEEVKNLNTIYDNLMDEYTKSPLTTAQRVQVLSEMRKTVQLRAVLLGLITLVGGRTNDES